MGELEIAQKQLLENQLQPPHTSTAMAEPTSRAAAHSIIIPTLPTL
jgi:hypothetical protein